MFLLVSVRHVSAHPSGHQHGDSIQISINLGKAFLRISRIRNILLTWILAWVFVYLPPCISQILDFIYWTVLIFFFFFFGSSLNDVTLKTSNSTVQSMKNRRLKMETFSARRQLQPDVTSWFVQYCACSCSPHCRRAPVGDVKLVCLALWREREYLTFISIRFVAFSDQNFADYRSWIVLLFFESHFKLGFQALLSKLTSL